MINFQTQREERVLKQHYDQNCKSTDIYSHFLKEMMY